jgi:hypothetical protein
MLELESDSFDTHEYITELKNTQSPEFLSAFDEYQKRFAI